MDLDFVPPAFLLEKQDFESSALFIIAENGD